MLPEELTTANVSAKVFEVIDAIAAQLGVAKEFVWEILVKQQYVEAAQLMIGVIFCVVVLVYSIPICSKGFKEEYSSGDADAAAAIIGLFVSVGASIYILCGSIACVGRLLNPEYYALKDILNMVIGGS